MEQIHKVREDVECLCDNTLAEGCFYAWHNWSPTTWASPLSRVEYNNFYQAQRKELEAVERMRAEVEALNALLGDEDDAGDRDIGQRAEL